MAEGVRRRAMRTVDEHLSAILGALTPLPPLDLSLLEAQGGVLAEPVVAPVPLPPFDNSAMGGSRLLVRPRRRVVVVATGNELREPGTTLSPGQIWDSNSFMLTAAVIEAGGVGYRQAIVSDDAEHVLETIEDQLGRADVIITTGGVSMGARDIVKEVLSDRVTFTPVAMRPGKPQGFGLLSGGIPIFTLPGNPVSAYISFQVFVRPALRALQ